MSRLSVNVDHLATLRQLRGTRFPDPVLGAYLAELGGADGITTHLRQDRRHIQDRDLFLLRQTVGTHLTLEMAPSEGMVQIALKAVPDMVTLVPERSGENTTERGFNLEQEGNELQPIIGKLQESGMEVSIFSDPTETNMRIAGELGADFVELNTTYYVESEDFEKELEEFNKVEGNPFLFSVEELHYYRMFKKTLPDPCYDRLVGRWDPFRPDFFLRQAGA